MGRWPLRCEWCGVYVKADTTSTRWRSQNADRVWHEHSRILCPNCHEVAAVELTWWKPIRMEK